MGFLELGAALKFLSQCRLRLSSRGNPQLFNYDTVLAAWIALSVSCSLYLLGLFRLPHDDKVEHIGVIRMLIAAGFLGLAVYLAPAMFGIHPAGVDRRQRRGVLADPHWARQRCRRAGKGAKRTREPRPQGLVHGLRGCLEGRHRTTTN